jgi:hypothetical protein
MRAKVLRSILLLVLLASVAGCAPSELFSSIDRHCFLADWTNHHSCVSCCCCKNGSCRRGSPVVLPMVELGNSAVSDAAMK